MTSAGTYESGESGNDYLKAFVPGAMCASSFVPDVRANSPEFIDDRHNAYVHRQTATGDVSFLSFLNAEGFVGTQKQIEGFSLPERPSESALDEALAQVRDLEGLQDNWDGEGSKAPKPEVVSDAVTVLQNWPETAGIPEPVLDIDGNISLEVYTDDGYSTGGVELIGNNEAIYTLVSGQALVTSGAFNTTNQGQIIRAMEDFNRSNV